MVPRTTFNGYGFRERQQVGHLCDREVTCCGRDGRGLSGTGREAEPYCRDQGAAACAGGGPGVAGAVLEEARAASQLNHPNVITVHDIGCEDGRDYLVMEYVTGRPLDELIPKGGLRSKVAIEYALQIASAMSAAHRAGIGGSGDAPRGLLGDIFRGRDDDVLQQRQSGGGTLEAGDGKWGAERSRE